MDATLQHVARQYEQTVHAATGLTLKFVPAEESQLPKSFGGLENPFCALIHQWTGNCLDCPRVQQHLLEQVSQKLAPHLAHCSAGLVVLAIPVVSSGQHQATLIGGHVLDHPPDDASLAHIAQQLAECGVAIDMRDLTEAYRATPYLPPKRLRATVRLLDYLTQKLGESATYRALAHNSGESKAVAVAKDYVASHLAEPVHLAEVAHYVHLEQHYFCRLFHNETGLTFGAYLAQRRVGEVKRSLADSTRRISEIAFECGFGSIQQFNRVFRKYTGQSPTAYRLQFR